MKQLVPTKKRLMERPADAHSGRSFALLKDRLRLGMGGATQDAATKRLRYIERLADKITSYVKPGIKPVDDVGAYYQRHRKATKHGSE